MDLRSLDLVKISESYKQNINVISAKVQRAKNNKKAGIIASKEKIWLGSKVTF